MKLSAYQTGELLGKMPKGVKASSRLLVKLSATCSACGHTEVIEEDASPGNYNVEFAIRERLKFTEVKTTRDRRSTYPAEFLLCPDCNRTAQDWMGQRIPDLPELPEQKAIEA